MSSAVIGSPIRYCASRVWDGDASAPIRDGVVDVADGLIVAVGTRTSSASAEVDTVVVDLGDVTLMPGLINSHVHLTFDSSQDVVAAYMSAERDGVLVDLGLRNAAAAVGCGTTTVRDLGAPTDVALTLRAATEDGRAPGPSILISGSPLTTPGGHCHFLSHELAPDDDPDPVVQRLAAEGVDVLKVFASGGNLTPGSSPLQRQFDLDRLTRIVSSAGRHGLTVAAHAHGADSVVDAVSAGVHTVEHCSFITAAGPTVDHAVLAAMVSRDTIAVPTVNHHIERLRTLDLSLVPPAIRDKIAVLQAQLPAMLDLYRQIIDSGVAVAAGTDAGAIPDANFDEFPQTIAYLASPAGLGMGALGALRAATSVAARACGVTDRGRLAAGLRADLLAVDGDPLTRIEDLVRTTMVVVGGREVVSRPPGSD